MPAQGSELNPWPKGSSSELPEWVQVTAVLSRFLRSGVINDGGVNQSAVLARYQFELVTGCKVCPVPSWREHRGQVLMREGSGDAVGGFSEKDLRLLCHDQRTVTVEEGRIAEE